MVEIINGDPLSGLLTTIGFFIALILGRRIRMRNVKRRSKRAS
ncbi:MAG TPA: hypothetical protein VEG44_02845 [Candidatus Acidoferrales bacterium]|nr:hypothetical protein [Candidatus Acidoferrales bacterium]